MIQSAFSSAVLDSDRPVPDGLIDPDGRPAGARFDVYRNNVVASLTRALEAGFPVVRRLVGDAFFAAMAGVYVRAHPPTSRVLMLYGADFYEFMAGFPPVAHLAYLPDIARLEYAIRQSYHAADAPPVTADAFADLSEDQIAAARLILAPAVRLICSPWPIHDIWQANMNESAPKPGNRAESVLILRPALDPTLHVLPEHADTFIARIMQGQTISEATDDRLDLVPLLMLLLQGGAIINVKGKS